eukprot:2258382-Prymnesium_polylepis.1
MQPAAHKHIKSCTRASQRALEEPNRGYRSNKFCRLAGQGYGPVRNGGRTCALGNWSPCRMRRQPFDTPSRFLRTERPSGSLRFRAR